MMNLTIEQRNNWRLNECVNPVTGKAINVPGPTWKKLQGACIRIDSRDVVYIRENVAVPNHGDNRYVSRGTIEACTIIVTHHPIEDVRRYGAAKDVMSEAQFVRACGSGYNDDADIGKMCARWTANASVNPYTGRKIKEGGATWLALQKQFAEWKTATPTASKSMGESALALIERTCLNHEDPVTFDAWRDMTDAEIGRVVKLGSDTPGKHYYLTLDTAYNIYKTAIESGKPERARNPIAQDRVFTNDEIDDILQKMKAADPKFKTPVKDVPELKPGVELIMRDLIVGGGYHFVHVSVVDAERPVAEQTIATFGYLPGWIDTGHIGSADYTSGVLLSNLWTLWNERKFFPKYQEPYRGCTVKRLNSKKPFAPKSWFHNRGAFNTQAFIDLCQEVSDVLGA